MHCPSRYACPSLGVSGCFEQNPLQFQQSGRVSQVRLSLPKIEGSEVLSMSAAEGEAGESPPWHEQAASVVDAADLAGLREVAQQLQTLLQLTKKRIQQYEETKDSLLLLLPDDICCHVLFYCPPATVAMSQATARSMKLLVRSASELWWCFLARHFGFTKASFDQHLSCDPCTLFYHIASIRSRTSPVPIPCSVVFSDDGMPFPGHGPERALEPQNSCWCTRPGVNRNIDLVISLGAAETPAEQSEPAEQAVGGGWWLVTELQVATPGFGFSNAPREVLGWCTINPPDLAGARRWDLTPQEVAQSFEPNYMPTVKESSITGSEASFLFPSLDASQRPASYSMVKEHALTVPKIAKFVHFKILSSFDPEGHGPDDANVDVKGLWVLGVPLDDLQNQLGNAAKQPHQDPSYARLHDEKDHDWF